ncbi:MAG: CvpA family protein [Pyrinomonadaceae bacterium]|nr:CvpA family protein [Pyrinomonadaceae bacterium]
MTFNVIDILLVLLVLLSVLQGFRRGFILSTLDLLGWVGSLLAGLRFYQPVAQWLAPRVDLWGEVWDQPAAFLLVAITARILIHLLGYALLRNLPGDVHERRVNQVLGTVPGFVNGLITATIVASLLLAVPLTETLRERTRESDIVNRLAVYTERLETVLVPVFDDAIRQTLNQLTIRPESNERVELPYKVAESRARPELEAEMLELVNKERIAAGLRPLAADPELVEVARKHSADMWARGYFAHVTPDGRDPFERIREANVRFLTAGENLALAPTVRVAHTGLMNSPGHRANILHPQFGRVGIGIMDGRVRGLMVTQNFRD